MPKCSEGHGRVNKQDWIRCRRMGQSEKSFDAVAMMRSLRDAISAKIDGMTLEEEQAWLASQDLGDPFLERLRQRLGRKANDARRPSPGR